MKIKILNRLDDIESAQWDGLLVHTDPFVQHAFLSALERHECVGDEYGWWPRHVTLWDDQGGLVAAAPMYLKNNSYGELVFDWAWADAYERSGRDYYPKLVMAVPYTPATGPRMLVRPGADRQTCRQKLLEGAIDLAREKGYSSLHCLFPREEEMSALVGQGLSQRVGCQFHWHNRGYRSFDDFLSTLSAKKRKNIRQERRRVAQAGIELRRFHGDEMDEAMWGHWQRFYRSTFERKSGYPTLSESFFRELGRTMGRSIIIVFAYRKGSENPLAGALMFRSDTTLYGRHWGCDESYDGLHFEACYYQGLEYAIEQGLARFEPGAQGEHKVSRGFEPTSTYSAHWIAEPDFRAAVDKFVDHEHWMICEYMQELSQRLPYKHTDDEIYCGFSLAQDLEMPVNNRILVWQRD